MTGKRTTLCLGLIKIHGFRNPAWWRYNDNIWELQPIDWFALWNGIFTNVSLCYGSTDVKMPIYADKSDSPPFHRSVPLMVDRNPHRWSYCLLDEHMTLCQLHCLNPDSTYFDEYPNLRILYAPHSLQQDNHFYLSVLSNIFRVNYEA